LPEGKSKGPRKYFQIFATALYRESVAKMQRFSEKWGFVGKKWSERRELSSNVDMTETPHGSESPNRVYATAQSRGITGNPNHD
jgi:hypothetical protein